MFETRKTIRLILPLIALAASFALPAPAAVLPVEKLLPEDTLFFVCIPDFARARGIYASSPQARLWQDAAMKAFREKLTAKISEEYFTPLERDLGIRLDDYASLPQGQVTFALVPPGSPEKPGADSAFLLLLDTRDKSPILQTNLADLRKKWLAAGKPLRTDRIRNVEFSVVLATSNDLPKTLTQPAPPRPPGLPEPMENPDTKNAAKPELYLGQAESLLIIGSSARAIEKVLAAMAGAPIKPLGDLPAYAACQTALFRDAPLFAWANARPFIDQIIHRDDDVREIEADTNPLSFKWAKVVSALGLNGLKTLALSYNFSPDGSLFNLSVGAPEGERAGLLKLLAGEERDCSPPAFVPADVVKFRRWRLDGQKTWAGVQAMLGAAKVEWLNSLTFLLNIAETAAKDRTPDFSLKKDLVANLGDDIITYSKAPHADAPGGGEPPSILLLASPNPEQLANGLRCVFAVAGLPSGTPTAREFLGRKIHSIPGTAPNSPGLHYAGSRGYLAMSSDAGMIEEFLRTSEGQPKPLRDTPGLADATQKVTGIGTSLVAFSNEREDMRATFEGLKKRPAAGGPMNALVPASAFMMLLGSDAQAKWRSWLDFSLLPPFDQVSKYFSFSVHSLTATPDGLSLKYFMPVPPQLQSAR